MESSLSAFYPFKVAAVLAIVALVALPGRKRHHPFEHFGAANWTTTVRAVAAALIAGLIGEGSSPVLASAAAGLGMIATLLDGVDGWLARRSAMASGFGARFDLEIDALAIQGLAILAWQFGKAGPWVLASGLLRYVFVAAGWRWRWLRAPLSASPRGRVICVVQTVGLILAISPILSWPASAAVAAASLAALSYSFLVDVVSLWRRSDG